MEKEISKIVERKVPWQGFQKIEGAATAEEAIQSALLDWNVSPQPLFCAGQQVEGRYGLVRDVDSRTLGFCGRWYRPVQNREAFGFIENLVGEELSFDTIGSVNGGQRVFISTKFNHNWNVNGDDINLYLLLSNSHSGTKSLQVAVTPVRVVCQNTLITAFKRAQRTWSMVHSNNLNDKLTDARRCLQISARYMNEFRIFGEQAAEVKFSDYALESALDYIFPVGDSERAKKFREKKLEGFYKAYEADDVKPFRGTAWGFLNAISDYETHYAKKSADALMSSTLDGNQKLYQKAQEFFGLGAFQKV